MYSKSFKGSSQDYEKGLCQSFIRFSSGSRSNLHIRILSGMRATLFEDLGKKITRSERIRNCLVVQNFNQGLVQNFSQICVSNIWKINSILIRKCKELAKIFTGCCLVSSVVSISWDSLEGSLRIINFKDPVRFDSGFYLELVQALARIVSCIDIARPYQNSLSILFRNVTKVIRRISSRFH